MQNTVLNDNHSPAEVAPAVQTARTSISAPLVSTVTAGSAGSAGSGKKAKKGKAKKRPATLLSVLAQLSASGGGSAIDPGAVSDNLVVGHDAEVTNCEAELIDFLRFGKPGIIFDDPRWLASTLEEKTKPLSIAREYYAWREARRVFIGQIHQYIAYVEQDEARREEAEQDIDLLPTRTFSGPENKPAIAEGREHLLSRLMGIAAYMGTKRGSWETDDMLDRFGNMPGLKVYQHELYEAVDTEEMLRTFGGLLFADKLGDVDDLSRALEIRVALHLAATYLDAPMGSPENHLLIAAAVAVGRIRGTENYKAPTFDEVAGEAPEGA
ncbi:MAG: hypothetical protein V4671_16795 [Armatimonadota bacterium]